MPGPIPVIRTWQYYSPERERLVTGTATLLANTITLVGDDLEAFLIVVGPVITHVRLVFVSYVLGQQPVHWTADPGQLPVSQRNNWVHYKTAEEMAKLYSDTAEEPYNVIGDWLVLNGYARPPQRYIRTP